MRLWYLKEGNTTNENLISFLFFPLPNSKKKRKETEAFGSISLFAGHCSKSVVIRTAEAKGSLHIVWQWDCFFCNTTSACIHWRERHLWGWRIILIDFTYSLHEESHHFDFSASLFDNIWLLKFLFRRFEFEITYSFVQNILLRYITFVHGCLLEMISNKGTVVLWCVFNLPWTWSNLCSRKLQPENKFFVPKQIQHHLGYPSNISSFFQQSKYCSSSENAFTKHIA